jgi:hypothetical protein
VLQAALLQAGVRLGLWVLPFATLRGMLAWLAAGGTPEAAESAAGGREAASRAVWAVEAVGRQWPAVGTCLIQALAAHVLLGRRGCPSNLRIGVKRDASGTFVAHAWLEQGDTILIGGEPHAGYIGMPVLSGLDRQ